jgi:hypothetical protein
MILNKCLASEAGKEQRTAISTQSRAETDLGYRAASVCCFDKELISGVTRCFSSQDKEDHRRFRKWGLIGK